MPGPEDGRHPSLTDDGYETGGPRGFIRRCLSRGNEVVGMTAAETDVLAAIPRIDRHVSMVENKVKNAPWNPALPDAKICMVREINWHRC
jgi:hypothetical protein